MRLTLLPARIFPYFYQLVYTSLTYNEPTFQTYPEPVEVKCNKHISVISAFISMQQKKSWNSWNK